MHNNQLQNAENNIKETVTLILKISRRNMPPESLRGSRAFETSNIRNKIIFNALLYNVTIFVI